MNLSLFMLSDICGKNEEGAPRLAFHCESPHSVVLAKCISEVCFIKDVSCVLL